MRAVSYVGLRRDTGVYFFRWTIPAIARPLLGGKTEVKRSLHTDQRRAALRLARRLSVMLERATFQLMATQVQQQDSPAVYLTIKLLERFVDGSIRMEGVEIDPQHPEADQKLLAALLGTTGAKAGASPDRRTLTDLVHAYFEHGDREKRWTAKTRGEVQAIYGLLSEVLGADKPLAELSRKDFAYFKETLAKLPSNRTKDPRYRGKGVLELVGMKVPDADLMGLNTLNKVLTWISALMKWGVIHGYVSTNYAEGMTLAKAKRNDEEREPYTDDEVRTLTQAVVTGSHGSDRFPYMKWVPLIGAYTGMRLNEICQLTLDDFSEVDGIPVIHVTDDGEGEKRLKTANSRRVIPVHPELLRLGLLEYVADLRKKRVTRLFHELSLGRDGYGAVVSKWFRRFRGRLALKREFHALRHTVATKLREAGVVEDVVADLLGHTRSTRETFGRYASAASVRRLSEALNRLSYEEKQATPLRLVA